MVYKIIFCITLTMSLGLSASQVNNSNLLKTESIRTVGAFSLVNKSNSVGTETENISVLADNHPALLCVDRMIEMQEKTASLYKAQNKMLEKLAENQENLHKKLQTLQDENKILKQRISDLEKQKNS